MHLLVSKTSKQQHNMGYLPVPSSQIAFPETVNHVGADASYSIQPANKAYKNKGEYRKVHKNHPKKIQE